MAEIWTPRPHQDLIVNYCWQHKRCSIWAHPGLGKTSAIYKLLDILMMCGSNFFPVLVIAPLPVARDVWPAEQQKWIDFKGIRVVPIIGSTPARRIAATMLHGDVYTINYENLPWLKEYFGDKWPFKIVIADESTKLRGYRLKGQGGKRATALGEVAHLTGRWINLTGTPSPKGLESLWGQQWFVDFGSRLGHSYTDFLKRWFTVDPYTREVEPRPNARPEIYRALADCAIALRAEDWLDVQAPHFFERKVELPEGARAQYRTMEKKFFADMPDKKIVAFAAVAKSGKLIQMASGSIYDENHVDHWVHDAKIESLRSLYDELGENLLVVYHFNFDIRNIQKEFPEAIVYHGKTQEDLWNSGKAPMMLVHPKSAGHGLNLQHGGRAVCFFTNTWDLELRLQVLERIGPARQLQSGYNRAVLVYDIIANKTVDENVLDRLSGRATEQEALMAARARSAE
jgi:SNF2 family DNA or RNA helicase